MHKAGVSEEKSMDLAGKQVSHETFGKGEIVQCDGAYVKVGFSCGHKEFVFPDAFGTYLRLTDQKTRRRVGRLVSQKAAEHKLKEEELKRQKDLQEVHRKRRLELERRRSRPGRRIHPQSQSVFWCKSDDAQTVFDSWVISTGVVRSGPRANEPKRLARVGLNTACLLTSRAKGETEKKRRIIGAFMAGDTAVRDGRIHAHPEYRLRLSDQESKNLLYWNYSVNPRYPHKMTWNTGRHRYFDNIWMAQILRDVADLRKVSEERELVHRFLRYLCAMNEINVEEIPAPEGALLRA